MTEPNRRSAPEVKDFGRISLPDVVNRGEKEGREIYFLADEESELAKLTVVWRKGRAEFDSPGVVAMMAAMLNRGTSKLGSNDISEAIEDAGGAITTVAGSHVVMMTIICLNKNLDRMLDIACQIIKEPSFPEEYLTQESGKLEADLKTSLQRVTTTASRRIAQLMMGENHPRTKFAQPGDYSNVGRAEIVACHKAIMGNEMPVIYFTGQTGEKTMERIMKFTQEITPEVRDNAVASKVTAYYPKWTEGGRECVEHGTQTVQSAVQMALMLPNMGGREDYLLRIAVHALGGYFGSRLSANIREERGLTYGISAVIDDQPEGRLLRIACQTDEANVDEVVEQTRIEIGRLGSEAMSVTELKNVVGTMKSGIASLLGNRHSIIDTAMTLRELGRETDAYDKLQDVLETVTAEEIRDVAAEYLDSERLTIVTTTTGG